MARDPVERWGKADKPAATKPKAAQPTSTKVTSTKAKETTQALAEVAAPDIPNDEPLSDAAAGFAKEQLKSFIERVERLEEEKKTIAEDIKDVFAEAKGTGFDVKALRAILKMRKEDANQRAEHEAIVDLYMQALGMVPFEQLPLGQSMGER